MTDASDDATMRGRRLPTTRDVLWIAVAALVYFAAARLSLRLLFAPEGIAAVWPPEGIFLSAILLTRRAVRPWLVGVLFLADLSAELLAGTSLPVSVVYALALTGSAAFSAFLLLRFVGPRIDLSRIRGLIAFIGLAIVITNATMSLLAAAAAQTVPAAASFWRSWELWATSDGIGNLLVTPMILAWAAWARGELGALRARRAPEAVALFLPLVLMGIFVFPHLTETNAISPVLTYATIPFLLWAALRFGVRGTSAALLLLATFAIRSALNSQLTAVIDVQLFVASIAVPALLLAAIVNERAAEHAALLEREEQLRALNAELEGRVLARTRELVAVNRELESFAYAVSHDLRAPLRALDGFSQAVLEDCADQLDAEDADYLERIRHAAQHMGELIDALLTLSRVGRREIELTTVDVSGAARRIAAALAESEPDRQTEVTIDDGLTAQADARLLDVILENLLGNAWKFTSGRSPARIEVGSLMQDGDRVFYVRDNGAGFDPAYTDKLFTPFQRLHTDKEFSGTGVGLATVQRAVTRHGGRCWLEGKVDHGATAYFTLPTEGGAASG
jgi:signal transduction histidine kinase